MRSTWMPVSTAGRVGVLSLVMLVAAAPKLAAQDTARTPRDSVEASVEKFALAWLALLDRGDHEAAWNQNFSMMRASVPLPQWRDAIVQSRALLEPSGARVLIALERSAGMDPVPGEQFKLAFRTRTATGQEVSETLVATNEDGQWRIAAYGVRR